MKKHFKRWIAFLLAVVLVTTTCLFSSDSFLRASEDGEAAKESVEETMETQELIVPQPEEPVQEPAPAEEEPAPVQEPAEETQPVQPEEPAGDMPAGDEIEVTPEIPAAEETIVPTPEPAVEETVVPTQEPAAEEPAATEEPAPTSTPAATPEMPAATQTPMASASPTPTATPDGEEETKSFGYEIRYYYDGVEDEESRVVKEDGVPDELILDADTVKEKLIRDGKEYTLDKIVNKNGKITENAEDNVVEVYYVSAGEEKPETTKAYSLKFKTVPSEGGRVEVISPKAEETDTSNTYKGDTEVTFEVSAKEGYELLSVENQDEEELKADSEEEGISTYAVTMTEDMVVTVTFEEVKEEVKMPAQTFETSAGGISITISAPEGVLPEGTTVKAVPVSRSEVEDAVNEKLAEEGMKAVDIVAVDITLYDKDGNEIQPKGELSVTFGNISASENAETAAVFHVDTDSNAAEKVAEVSTEASAAGFQTDHFSVWTYVTGESADTLAADEGTDVVADVTIQVGKSETLTGTGTTKYNWNGYEDSWTSDNVDVVEVRGDKQTATITGRSLGIATVTHIYFTKSGNKYTKHTETWTIIVIPAMHTIKFSLNRGEGTLPQEISGETGTIIELPSGEGISRDGYKLLGWSESQDANTVSEGSAAAIYNLGSEYEITSDKTLYAIWAQESGDKIGKIQAAIRKDGTVPDEPSIQNADYSYFDLLTDVNVLEYFSPAHTVSGSIVNSRLTDKFKNWIEGQNNQKGFWDTETQYVEWYVIKYQGNDSRWHIDGVVRDKEKVNLTYDRNGATGGLVPDSNQYSVGSTVKVAGNPYSLAKMGYNWVGWNTKADGTGTTYTEGNEITLNESVTLYAKWEAKNSTKYRVEHYKQNLNGDGYDLAETEELSGRTDSIANAIPKTTFTGFEYDADTSAETKSGIITADEELVLKLYYSRSGYAITYIWAEDTAQIVKDNRSVPQDNNTYLYESPFTADDTEYEAVETYDNYNNVTGRYTFAGWNPQNGIVTDHLTIVGTWEYTPVDVIKHTVTYNWIGLPDATLYDANGREIPVPHCPVDDGKYVNGQSYTVDGAKYSDVYTKDAFGNLNAKYTLGEWDKTGEQIMGESDVTISAEWKCEKILVSTWTITYEWDGDEPTGRYTQVKPTDPKTYTNNESYTVDTKYGKDYTFNTTDEYGNVNGAYTFSGWNTENGNITSNLTITGTWSFEETTVAKHNAVYGWSGLPNEQLYDAAGNEVQRPAKPEGHMGLVKGQGYTVDGTRYGDVYTKDAFGNLNAKYTLGEWDKTGEQTMGESDVTISAEWKCEKILVSTWTITYEWDGDEPTGKYTQVKPTDPKTYTNNESYTVDTKYGKDYTFNTTDEYGNVNGAYTFSGWDTENGNITSDLTITGKWTFRETTVATHNVVYSWSDLPDAQLYDAAGNAVQRPAKPEGHMGLVKGQGYTVDGTRYGDVYTKDAFGNLNAKYTLGEWNDPNGGVMGESNVTISAEWKSEKILVPTWKIKYEWSGDVPTGSYTQTEPTDSKTYINNESYTVDTKYGKGYTFNTTDKYGNINGAYTFSGWDTENGNITSDLTITGKWTFRETTVATHNVVYSWSDLPDAQLYDAAGNAVQRPAKPEGHMGLVKGQGYTVDGTRYGDVYTKDAFGNLNAKYTLGEWNDPNGGVMGESNVTISAQWNSETIPVSTWTITYEWDGDEPTGSYTQVKPTDPKTYTNNEGYTADTKYVDGYTFNTTDEYGNINGAYTFSGWSPKKGNITSNLTITGTWSFEETTVAKHNAVYGWSGLPNEQLYDAAGNAVQRPAKPEGHMGLVKGQGYTVDGTRYGDVYTKDAFGNLNAKYTLGEWNDPNGGVMGESDVTISAQWKSEKIPVPTWKIKYEWSGDVPTGSYTQTEPTDGKIYTNNESYTVDETFEEGYTFNTTDEYGNINGAYTFIGWDTENGNITSDLTITGKWIFRETKVATHNAVYSWSGLPDAQLYDAAGNAVQRPAKPEGHMGLVKGQGYTVDSAKYSNVYTKDAFGNLNAKYTLGEWNDPNGGVMGGSDVTISAVWILEDITVPQYAVTYKYNGNVPTGEIPPEDEIYYVNQPVTLAEEPSHEGYVFKGWDRADGFRMPNSPVEITGTWEVDFSDITAGKIMEIYSGETYTIPLDGILSGDQAEFFVNGEKVDNLFKDVTDQTVTVRITRGTDVFEENIAVRIDPRTVLLKSADRTERYTGNEYDMPELVEETGWVESEKVNIAYDFTGKQKWVGKSDNTFTAVSTNNEKVKLANYNIQYEYGILTVTDGSTEEPIGPDGVVTKTHDDREYRRGDTITFTITAVNIYNEAKTITITEQAGVTITGDSVFENVQPGDMVETTATYEVTDADIVRGSFSNTVSVSYSGGTTIDQTDVVDDIEEPNGHLTLTKETTSTPANGAAYALGETITYEIRALNDGNLTLTDVVVTDDLTGDSWTISEISPGQRSMAMMTSYTVTEADILAGSVVNVVTASGTSPDPDEPDVPVTPGTEEDPTSVPEPSLFAEKTASASVDGGTYGLGEEVTYTIRIVNNGNVTISNIEVKDDLTGDSWTTANLAPGESGSFEAVYTVTEDDIRAGRILNVASASGTASDGNPVDAAAEEEIFTDALDGSVNVVKTVTNPRTQYNVGDVINYQITVTNTGNVTLHNVRVEDVLNGTEGSVTFTDLAGGILENSTVVLPELAVGETANLRCEYTVARGDANASIGNRVEVTSDEGDDPSDDETDVTPVENIYNLTIHYVYADGTTAAPDVTAQYLEGESFSYTSPTIEGYTPNFLFLRTDVQGMPAKDVELTVVYTANPAVVTPPADDTPPAPPADDTPADDTPPAPPTAPVVPPADDTPVVPPAPPAPPAVPVVPAGPVAPVVPAPDDGLVAVEEEPVPTGGAVVADDDGNLTILPVEDEEVPLTNRQLDDHSCCILSFLLMLAAMIVYTCYTSSMKKRQKKIAKLRDQYEAEILRRELGLPSENNR